MTLRQRLFENEMVKAKERELVEKLSFLDSLVAIGEEDYEIESDVRSCAEDASFLFFGWLMRNKYSHGAELLAGLVPFIFQNIYLEECPRRRTLANAQRKDLQEIIVLVEFNVTEKEWNTYLNPFDAVLLFYRFLEDLGYPANSARRERALKQIRREVIKRPCHTPQAATVAQ